MHESVLHLSSGHKAKKPYNGDAAFCKCAILLEQKTYKTSLPLIFSDRPRMLVNR